MILYILVRNDPLQQTGQNGVRKKWMALSKGHLEVDSPLGNPKSEPRLAHRLETVLYTHYGLGVAVLVWKDVITLRLLTGYSSLNPAFPTLITSQLGERYDTGEFVVCR